LREVARLPQVTKRHLLGNELLRACRDLGAHHFFRSSFFTASRESAVRIAFSVLS
jgi:hypothetical protein